MRTRTAAAITAACLVAVMAATTTAGTADAKTQKTQAQTQQTQENWAHPSTTFEALTPTTTLSLIKNSKARDGRALRLTLPKGAAASPGQGVGVTSRARYRYGTFSTRMRTADCRKQKHAGVVTGAFTFANDGRDHDGNGITDNDEIDIEFLCAQPEVVYLTIWTDYSETTDAFNAITRTIDLRTGTVLSTCRRHSWADDCPPEKKKIKRIKNFDSATRFRTYGFDWQPDHVTYFTYDDTGHKIVLWNYRGRYIPDTAAPFMQNVWHSPNWDPLDGSAHAATTRDVSAYVDTTTIRARRS